MASALDPADEIKRLREANAQLSRFASQAAHDLQEPLRLIHGYLELLAIHHEGKLKLDAPKLARDALETTDRMQRLVTSLLDYARATSQPMKLEPLPLGLALADAVANLHLRIRGAGAQVTHGPLPTLAGDRGQITRLFQNLIDNSIKYADGRRPVVHVASRATNDGWLITVDDNGPGFPRVGRERLFEPFARLHVGDVPGAGLGLASARSVVERMGGRLVATDAPGGGARIEIHLKERS